MASEIEFWIEQVRAGTLRLEDVPKKLRSNVSDILGIGSAPVAPPRTAETTFTLEQMQAGDSIVNTIRNASNRTMEQIGRAGPPPTRGMVVDTRASSMDEVIAYLQASPEDMMAAQAAFLNTAMSARQDMVNIALEMVEARRKRRGWAARFNYPDRGGKHYLEDAIRESAIVQDDQGQKRIRTKSGGKNSYSLIPGAPTEKDATAGRGRAGSGLSMVAWDMDKLEEMTRPPRSDRGFIRMYEQGGRGIMPPGFWIGPTGPNTMGKTGRRFTGKRRGAAREVGGRSYGADRFYPGAGPSGVYMHEPAMHVLRDSLEEANRIVASRLEREFSSSIAAEHAARAAASPGAAMEELGGMYTANVDK